MYSGAFFLFLVFIYWRCWGWQSKMEELTKVVEEVSATLEKLAPLDFQSRSRNPGINEVAIKSLIFACSPPHVRECLQSEVQSTNPAEVEGIKSHRFIDFVYANKETSDTIVVELKYVKPENVKGCEPEANPPESTESETLYREAIPSSKPAARYAHVMERFEKTEIGLSTVYYVYCTKTKRFTKEKTFAELIFKNAGDQLRLWVKNVPSLKERDVTKVVILFVGPRFIIQEID